MDVKVQVSGEKATLSLSGRFDFTAYKEFRQYADRTVQNNGITGVEPKSPSRAYRLSIVRERYSVFLKSRTSINSSD